MRSNGKVRAKLAETQVHEAWLIHFFRRHDDDDPGSQPA
jgi:hypothetical protein